ncbi:hypothetical protein RHGRI_019221 [Rhododendron griersonianum]|uniref:Uncharacterized protein n=1 Tax=Rhododendron griersonianum TaxID=479676 RepID=A0AAV6JEB4_9ERIC|nr:hypothetical protein RHGRI_019221 [Rhododendron griersonianum]
MQRDRERAESNNSGGPFDGFGGFGGFGPQRSIMSSIFGGRDPFDDPFFTRPFGSMFGSSMFNSGSPFRESPQISSSKEPIIEELQSDDEEEESDDTGAEGKGVTKRHKHEESNKQPHVEHPDDKPDESKSKDVTYRSDYNKVEGSKPQARSVSCQKVTYGGINGPYYSPTTTRRTGSDGVNYLSSLSLVVLEECKQADITTGQAEHRISRGMLDKVLSFVSVYFKHRWRLSWFFVQMQGHSVTRRLNSDGKVDTNQTLHNLNEDELAGFEQAWKGNAEKHFPAWDDGSTFNNAAGSGSSRPSGWASRSSLALPFEGFSGGAGRREAYNEPRMPPSGGRPKKVVTINID